MGYVEIELEWHEILMAAAIGVNRYVESRRKGLKDFITIQGYGDNKWDMDIEGAASEMVVAKYLELYWDGSINSFKGGDVGRLQIRSARPHDYKLIVRNNDSNTDLFVLVTGSSPTYRIHGYTNGKQAKQAKWWKVPGGKPGAYFVPQEELKPLKPPGKS